MIKLENFDDCENSGYAYGGTDGSKLGIILNKENWFLKFPKSIKADSIQNFNDTSPLSEYIASHIYESIGIETHKTFLGIAYGKVVVACKDFLAPNEILFDYNGIRNSFDPKNRRI